MAATAAVAADLRKLQAEMDQMKERLDFISPMLPLVNFVQDYFQKVECEASMQLMRLKKAQVARPPGSEDDSDASLETAKWLHFVTDAVMALHAQGGREWEGPEMSRAAPRGLAASPFAGDAVPYVAEHAAPGGASSGSGAAAGLFGAGEAARRSPLQTPEPRSFEPNAVSGYPMEARAASPPSVSGSFLLGQRADGSSSGQVPSRAPPAMDIFSARGSGGGGGEAIFGGVFGGKDTYSSGSASFSQQEPSAEPLAEPGTTRDGVVGQEESATEVDGLVLGNGSWATSYRQASGSRRKCLRLLYSSGIVTARELSDDLTVISDEHINECVLIAGEMLRTWTQEMWAQQPDEAKKFFEARLTAMYQRKFGEGNGGPKGS